MKIRGKKGIEWYYLVILIVLVASLAAIAIYYSGVIPKMTEFFSKTVFGAID